MCTLIALAVLWTVALRILPTPPDRMLLVGGVTVVFGLYVGSRAAANMIDLMMFDRYLLRRKSTRLADLGWIGLNFLTVAAAWITIVEGTTRFISTAR